MKYPAAVSILTAKDITKCSWFEKRRNDDDLLNFLEEPTKEMIEAYEQDKLVCCLLGHANAATPCFGMHAGVRGEFYKAIREEIAAAYDNKETRAAEAMCSIRDIEIDEFNDNDKVSRNLIAAIWNRAMKRLGYNVPKKYLDRRNLGR